MKINQLLTALLIITININAMELFHEYDLKAKPKLLKPINNYNYAIEQKINEIKHCQYDSTSHGIESLLTNLYLPQEVLANATNDQLTKYLPSFIRKRNNDLNFLRSIKNKYKSIDVNELYDSILNNNPIILSGFLGIYIDHFENIDEKIKKLLEQGRGQESGAREKASWYLSQIFSTLWKKNLLEKVSLKTQIESLQFCAELNDNDVLSKGVTISILDPLRDTKINSSNIVISILDQRNVANLAVKDTTIYQDIVTIYDSVLAPFLRDDIRAQAKAYLNQLPVNSVLHMECEQENASVFSYTGQVNLEIHDAANIVKNIYEFYRKQFNLEPVVNLSDYQPSFFSLSMQEQSTIEYKVNLNTEIIISRINKCIEQKHIDKIQGEIAKMVIRHNTLKRNFLEERLSRQYLEFITQALDNDTLDWNDKIQTPLQRWALWANGALNGAARAYTYKVQPGISDEQVLKNLQISPEERSKLNIPSFLSCDNGIVERFIYDLSNLLHLPKEIQEQIKSFESFLAKTYMQTTKKEIQQQIVQVPDGYTQMQSLIIQSPSQQKLEIEIEKLITQQVEEEILHGTKREADIEGNVINLLIERGVTINSNNYEQITNMIDKHILILRVRN